jgi:hypothetical protein
VSGRGGDHGAAALEGRSWPTNRIERPGPAEAFAALQDADQALFAARQKGSTVEELDDLCLAAARARAVWIDALRRAS